LKTLNEVKSQPTIFIIYGGSGDLCWRKIMPALFNLFLDGWMPDKFAIVGVGKTASPHDEYRAKLLEGVNQFSRSGKAPDDKWAIFSKQVFYESVDLNDYSTYNVFCRYINDYEKEWGAKAYVIHYFAVAPFLFPVIAANIAKNNLAEQREHTRIVIEKPFGHDLESAKELNKLLNEYYKEEQIITSEKKPYKTF
jgi:glucose-6-phosphate 1-dehydrogenase